MSTMYLQIFTLSSQRSSIWKMCIGEQKHQRHLSEGKSTLNQASPKDALRDQAQQLRHQGTHFTFTFLSL
uniref:Uncharacterized protein n=1 Tax=Cucumis melo TaxID=3656 RepID=A0A9I9E583_CUCME